jgi:hypothetical protein
LVHDLVIHSGRIVVVVHSLCLEPSHELRLNLLVFKK